ncbi:hypothetical protein BX616_008187 [Lobosporangium transversale]|nr:hypothetical protein BX616_008187 [Lobosporangium transversale]
MGIEAIRMMITYEYQTKGTKRITAKISTENKGSIQLFLTQLGFVQIGYSEIFGEVTLERTLIQEVAKGDEPEPPSGQAVDKDIIKALTQTQFKTLELNQEDLDH